MSSSQDGGTVYQATVHTVHSTTGTTHKLEHRKTCRADKPDQAAHEAIRDLMQALSTEEGRQLGLGSGASVEVEVTRADGSVHWNVSVFLDGGEIAIH